MLVVVMDSQLLAPEAVCQGCLMADQAGQPRWQGGQLRCGRALDKHSRAEPAQYECQMGFRIAHIA